MKHRTYALTDHDVEVISCAFPLALNSSHINHWIRRTIVLSTPLYPRLEKSAKVNSLTLIRI